MLKVDFEQFEDIIIWALVNKDINEAYANSCMEYLKPDMFKNDETNPLFTIIKNYWTTNDRLPSNSEIKVYLVGEKEKILKKIAPRIKAISDIDSTWLLQQTENFIKERLLMEAMEKAIIDRDRGKLSVADYSGVVDSIQAISLFTDYGIEFVEYADTFIEKLHDSQKFIPTGFPTLDAILGGGFFKDGKAFYMLAGETNIGKSMVAGAIAANIFKAGYSVLIISLEMSEFRYYQRLSQMVSTLSVEDIINNSSSYKVFTRQYAESANRLRIKEFPPGSISSKGVRSFVKKLKKEINFRPDVIFIDYHGLLKTASGNGTGQRDQDMAQIVRELRALTYEFECPMVSLAQINRAGVGSGSPGLDKLAGSYAMASDADFIMGLGQTEEDHAQNIICGTVLKIRDGNSKKKVLRLQFDTRNLQYTDLEAQSEMDDNPVDFDD